MKGKSNDEQLHRHEALGLDRGCAGGREEAQVSRDACLIASALVEADGLEQADVLNEFVTQLEATCRHNNKTAEDQGYYIAQHLRERTAKWLEELVKSYEFWREEARNKRLEIEELNKRRRELQEELDHIREQMTRETEPF